MESFTRVALLENEFEAEVIDLTLRQHGIPHDSALDGLFQMQQGWGCVLAHDSDALAIEKIVGEIRTRAAEEAEEQAEDFVGNAGKD